MDGLGNFTLNFSVGIAVGICLDFVWRKTEINKYERRLEALEHYHWGLVILILVRMLLNFIEVSLSFAGTGVTFIVAEIMQNHPFAFRSNHQFLSTIIGLIFFFLAMFTWFR